MAGRRPHGLFVCLFVCLRCSKQSLGYFAHADDELRRPLAAKLPPLASASKAPCAPQAESPSRGWLQPTVPAAVMPVSAEACAEGVPSDGADCKRQTRVLEPDIALPDFGLDRGAQPRGARTHGARSVLAALEPHGQARLGSARVGLAGKATAGKLARCRPTGRCPLKVPCRSARARLPLGTSAAPTWHGRCHRTAHCALPSRVARVLFLASDVPVGRGLALSEVWPVGRAAEPSLIRVLHEAVGRVAMGGERARLSHQ